MISNLNDFNGGNHFKEFDLKSRFYTAFIFNKKLFKTKQVIGNRRLIMGWTDKYIPKYYHR